MAQPESNPRSKIQNGSFSCGGFISFVRCALFLIAVESASHSSQAAIVRGAISYPPSLPEGTISLVAPASFIDYNQDGLADLNFYQPTAIGNEWTTVTLFGAAGAGNAEMLSQNGYGVSLSIGSEVGPNPQNGDWASSVTVWSVANTSMRTVVSIAFNPDGTTTLSTNEIGGVTVKGINDILGVRFLAADGAHYGWVSFAGGGWNPQEFFYETAPNTAVTVVPEPSVCALSALALVALSLAWTKRRTGRAG